MSIIDRYADRLLDAYSAYPRGRFVTLLLLRHIESEAIFRTEGSGEPLNKEFVFAGERSGDDELIQRVVISKRKQTAVERRMGRELLREHNLLRPNSKGTACSLNTNNPCEKCIDCMVYGYAAGGGGAQRSRVITDDAFSLHPAATITGTRQFNALFDNSTMRNPDTNEPSTSIGTDEYIKPQSLFLDMETLKDVTRDELHYILGNVLRASRYGAISSRIGKVRNHLIGIAFSNCELFSNLEWVQSTYDRLRGSQREPDFPVHVASVSQHARVAAETLRNRIIGRVEWLQSDELGDLVEELGRLYADSAQLTALLNRLATSYPRQ
ncbi:MAG: type I-D CRISPR-associated protein Cas7/Csc2 [Kouleothrix sp.]|jgi:CRISPR-associated protein Csc2|nr:type I-D CRISPR-associated protein Cas7/Csc2 [Kouleothrix sp.]